MQPHDTNRLTRALIGLQLVAIVTLVGATFAAVIMDVPLYLATLFLGVAGLIILVLHARYANSGVLLFGGSGLVFAVLYYLCLYAFDLPLSPLYLVVLGYAVASIAGGFWLMSRLKPHPQA